MDSWLSAIMMGCFLLAAVSAAGAPSERIRVACVGDSITYGAGLADPARESYPAILQSLLGEGYEVRNFGVNGATALRNGSLPYWILPEFDAAKRFAPRVVVLMLGTNDSHMRNRGEREQYEADLRALARQLADLDTRPAMVLNLPPPCYGVMSSYAQTVLRREILPAIRRVADAERWRVADVHAALSGRPEWFPDGVHPNASGAAAIARTVYETVRALSTEGVSP
ncbi:MAG TPA: GDSL-type esterase/lipase family protein [Kiritimatiellia bacterium]|nr:GDSL-type esterase/lipase family protein [Kiritimatiellia bacterium]HRZ12536.1 GDSL-type esterase/lipase family protein [Kiritimatiellia bacterium]HSA17614.1 GDSL-type esterase/lipase family protein [Kiritimatiellia bacterium]